MKIQLFSLVLQGVLRKRRSSILAFSVLLLSFAFAIASISLVGSISKTNQEFRLNTYGDWYLAIPDGSEEDSTWLQKQSWAEAIGIGYSYGYVQTETRQTGIGTIDENFKSVGRLKLISGHWPEADNEIVLEEDTLGLLGYDYALGQEINIPLMIPCGEKHILSSGTFVLCGIIKEYSDLWVLYPNSNNRLLIGAIVTENGGKHILEHAESLLTPEMLEQGVTANKPIPQFFVNVNPEKQESASNAVEAYLLGSRTSGDSVPCINTVAHQSAVTAEYDGIYVFVIAIVAMLAVLCIYIIQLPTETKSFATLRCLGITRGQMGALLLTESLLLCFPALLLGIPASIGITRLAMRFLVYAGSVEIQVAVPWIAVYSIALLWISVVVISRLLVYFVTLQTPLTGRMQLRQKSTRYTTVFRRALILLLLIAFGFITVFTSMEVISPNEKRKSWESYPPYTIWGKGLVSESKVTLLQQVPGVSKTEGFGELWVYLSYPGLEEREVYLYAVNEEQWEETFRFGESQEAFHNGDLVLILFPDETVPMHPDVDRNFVYPEDDVILKLYDGKGVCIMESKPTLAELRLFYDYTPNKLLAGVYEPYTIVCSEEYLKNLLESMEPGTRWDKRYVAGDPFGYGRVYAYVERTADDLSTDIGMAELCKKLDITLDNRREQFWAYMQQYTQDVLLLCGSSICIALMLLLILTSTIALETEQEKRQYTILHRLGMSPWQRRARIWGKALIRSLCSITAGWSLYIAYATSIEMRNGIKFAEAVQNLLDYLKLNGLDSSYVVIVSTFCILITLTVCGFSKRNLKKEACKV